MYILKVLVEHNTYSLKDSFYYVSNEEVKKGSRVNITFNNQHLVGFVVETIYQDLSLEEMQQFSKFIENDVYNYITLDASVNSRNSYGGTSAESVMTQVKMAKSFLDDNL